MCKFLRETGLKAAERHFLSFLHPFFLPFSHRFFFFSFFSPLDICLKWTQQENDIRQGWE